MQCLGDLYLGVAGWRSWPFIVDAQMRGDLAEEVDDAAIFPRGDSHQLVIPPFRTQS